MAIYSYTNGELKPLDSSDRVWVGTQAAWEALGDEQPKNCLVAFTDDYASNTFKDYTSQLVAGDGITLRSNTFCFVSNRICQFTIYFTSSANLSSYKQIVKAGMPQITQEPRGIHPYQYHYPIYPDNMVSAPIASCYIAENTISTINTLTSLTIASASTTYMVSGSYVVDE